MRWVVTVPNGWWMAGVHHFRSKVRADAFADRWYNVEANCGRKPPLLLIEQEGTRVRW